MDIVDYFLNGMKGKKKRVALGATLSGSTLTGQAQGLISRTRSA